jgi:exopolyphosphatase/guanosine-5'-triphosphate,3'-diphosphate pyrophosphatase
MAETRSAVIDLGSNSFRLVVFTSGEGWWRRTDEIYEAVRIGAGMAASGRLGRRPMERALATVEVFAHFCRATGLEAQDVDAVATSAIRDAENRDVFLERAKEISGLEIRVLPRDEEARYGYLAAVNATTLADGVVLDLGGGSMQLVQVKGRLEAQSCSWRLGAVRMTERFLAEEGPAAKGDLKRLRAHVANKLGGASWLPRSGSRLVGIGGTVRNLAAAAQRAAGEPTFSIQGYCITRSALEDLIGKLAAMPAAERKGVPGIKPGRGDLILAGAVVVAEVLEAGGFDAIEATEAGLREGVFFERHVGGDPPLFDDVRRASVLNLAAQYRVDPAHTEHVATLALGLFDELAAAGLHRGDRIERELLWAACVLHDIGVAVDYDDHHKHSRYLILNAGLPGFTPSEVAVIAQAARYHRKGRPDPGELAPLFGKEDVRRLDRCATLLRLAEDLERSRDQLVREAHVVATNGSVRLDLVCDGDVSVPRWAAGREVELFAQAFDRRLVVGDDGPAAR